MLLAPYPLGVGFDEMFADDGRPRASGERFVRRLETLASGNLQQRQKTAELHLQNMGITFNVYSHEAGTEKVWPFDLLPRIIDATEWSMIERGLEQRIRALNLFIDDIYNDLKIIKDKAVGTRPRVAFGIFHRMNCPLHKRVSLPIIASAKN